MSSTIKIDEATYNEIAQEIHSESSPVGIDAKKTHILILQKLLEIDQRLKRIESQLEAQK